MNTIRPMRTNEEVKKYMVEYENNTTSIAKMLFQQRKKKYNDNKEAIASKKKEKIHCEACEIHLRKADIARHNKGKRHQNNITKLQNIP